MSAAAGSRLQPVYPRYVENPAQPWREGSAWTVSSRVDHPDAGTANALALADLQGGADALSVVGAASPFARGFGLPAVGALATALDGIELDLIAVRFDVGAAAPNFAEDLAELVAVRRLGSAGLAVDLGYDPIALLARTSQPEPRDHLVRVLAAARTAGLAGRPLLSDARVWHEAGAEPARELGLAVATVVSHWRSLAGEASSLEEARRAVAVLVPFDADVLCGLAKARAIRRLWARLEEACGLSPSPLRLHAETSWRMMTRQDPWTNAMRTTTAAFAAGLGGADAVTVLPMTLATGLPDAAARRLARNTDRVLLDECGLGEVEDSASGSGTVEALTHELCRSAWAIFQEVERGGGIERSLRDGTVAAALAVDAARRRADVATLARGIVGISRFPSLDVPAMPVLAPAEAPVPAPPGALPSSRDAEVFEALRDRAQAGAAPRAFLATLGEPATFGRSASLAGHLFAAAGIATEPPPPLARNLDENLAAYAEAPSPIACVCGDAAGYASDGEAMVAALRGAGARMVLVADGSVVGAIALMPSGDGVLPILGDALKAFGL